MKIEKGTSRIAIVGECATLKIPKLRLGLVISGIKDAIERHRLPKYLTGNEKNTLSLANHLLRGWLENWREWRLSKEIAGTVVPTRFSIFGIINLQDTAPNVDSLEYGDVYIALSKIIDKDLVFKHGGHTLPESENFGMHDGKLKIRDYGELGLDVLLKNYGKQLQQALDETMAKIRTR